MKFFIKSWPDETATLMTQTGRVIWTFSSMRDAIDGCAEWIDTRGELPAGQKEHFKYRYDSAA
ncbi:MAG: hypothetical protein ACYDBW_01525 [Sulfuricaulis sp.]